MANNQIFKKILGIDYGMAKVGLATADGPLAEPLTVIRYKNEEDLIKRLGVEIEKEKVDKIVVGISEGAMAEDTKKFISVISHKLSIPVETFDETLTTHEAQSLSREAGISAKKRRKMEDAYAAAVMLQNYLDFAIK